MLRAAAAAVVAAALMVSTAPACTAAYEIGSRPHAATGTAKARTATLMADAPRMSRPADWAKQRGTYRKGRTVTLECYTNGTATFGRGSANIPGGFSRLWYRVSDGYYVADVHLDTGSNTAVTRKCPTLTSNVSVTTTAWQRITSNRTGARVGLTTSTAYNRAAVRSVSANARSTQKFRFIRDEFGTYRIVSATKRSQVITASGGPRATTKAGAKLVTRRWDGRDSQRWVVRATRKDGYVTLRPASNPKLCLTAPKSGSTKLTVEACGERGQWFRLNDAGTASTFTSAVASYYGKTYGTTVAGPGGTSRGICHGLTENYLERVHGITVTALGDYVPGGGDGAGTLRSHGLTWHSASTSRALRTGDIVVFQSRRAGHTGHVGIWYNGRLYDQNNATRSYFNTARVSPYPVSGMQLVGYWRA
ncbi:hypothetical protein SAMN05421637_0184 [Demequina mangrovi]|uniref:Ricin B lectin domain-containing protein n=2 Tax=Demequina mangrovi TaxID=1043493 RepID=A0A1H6U609_9MICO|nr:hypothetical protein SAMN05421637_0184 [Demequina mangrovi]